MAAILFQTRLFGSNRGCQIEGRRRSGLEFIQERRKAYLLIVLPPPLLSSFSIKCISLCGSCDIGHVAYFICLSSRIRITIDRKKIVAHCELGLGVIKLLLLLLLFSLCANIEAFSILFASRLMNHKYFINFPPF